MCHSEQSHSWGGGVGVGAPLGEELQDDSSAKVIRQWQDARYKVEGNQYVNMQLSAQTGNSKIVSLRGEAVKSETSTTHHSSQGGGNDTTVHWDESAADTCLQRKGKSTDQSLILGRRNSVKAHLHHLILVVEVCDQDVFSVRHSGEGDSQSPAGPMVTVSWKSAAHHVTYNLHQVEGRMHGAEEPLPRLLCNINDACTSFSWKDSIFCVNNDTFTPKQRQIKQMVSATIS